MCVSREVYEFPENLDAVVFGDKLAVKDVDRITVLLMFYDRRTTSYFVLI